MAIRPHTTESSRKEVPEVQIVRCNVEMMRETHIYVPTEEDKEMLRERCAIVIGALSGLSVVQKAMVLKLVTDGFVKLNGVEHIEVVRDE
jgi:hypothetical protein